MKVLIDGVAIGEQVFRFIGHSNSQMKSKTCWLHQGSLEENEDILDRVGYFKSIKSASKRAKRVGLLFTNISSWISVSEKFKEEEDEDIEMNLGFTTVAWSRHRSQHFFCWHTNGSLVPLKAVQGSQEWLVVSWNVSKKFCDFPSNL